MPSLLDPGLVKYAVLTDTPWGTPIAAPYENAWSGIPNLGRCVHREATHRGHDLQAREIEAMLQSLQIVEDLEAVLP